MALGWQGFLGAFLVYVDRFNHHNPPSSTVTSPATCHRYPVFGSLVKISRRGFKVDYGHTQFQLRRRPALDGVRGLAIIGVVLFHSETVHLQGGFLGVDLFFVLSGFLITSLLYEELATTGSVNFRSFYMRRVLRLVPASLTLLAGLWVAVLLFRGHFATGPELMLRATGWVLIYANNWVSALQISEWPAVMGHLWSLAVEEQFYIVWPALVAWLLKRRLFAVATFLALMLAVASAGWRAWLQFAGAPFERLYFATDTRGDGLLIGCTLALLVYRRGTSSLAVHTASLLFGGLILGILAVMANNSAPWMYYCGFWAASCAAALTIFGALEPAYFLRRPLESWPLTTLGRLSYGLYLWNHVMNFAVKALSTRYQMSAQVRDGVAIAATLTVGALSYLIVERPALRLKKRFST